MEFSINHGCVMYDACMRFCFPLIVSMFIVATYVRYMSSACYIYHDFMNTIFLYRKVFEITVSNVSDVSIVVAVGLSADTFTDTLACQVSKISLCIRYDGYASYLGMVKTNMENVRFCTMIS